MKFVSRLLLDQISDALGRPQTGAIPQGLRPLFQSAGEPIQVRELQARFAASPSRFPKRFGSLFAPSLMPAADRLAMNPQLSGYLALTQAAVKKFSGPEPPLFQVVKITCHAFRIAHVQRLP